MKEIEVLAPSPEEAREKASAQSGIPKEHLEVIEEYEPDDIDLKEYAEQNNLESLPAKDEVSLYVISVAFSHYVGMAQEWTQGLVELFAPGAKAEAVRFRHLIIIRIEVPESSILIGKHGATLDALQHVVVRALITKDEDFPDIMLDVERYREKKLVRLEKEAQRAADKAVRNGRRIPLPPMSPAERKFIHNFLKDIQGVRTESRGKDRDRHIMIEPLNPRPQGGGRGGGRGGFQGRGDGNRQGGGKGRSISDEQRSLLYGGMKEQFENNQLEIGHKLLKGVPGEDSPQHNSEDTQFADELE